MTNSDGCLWTFITIVITVIGFGVIKSIIDLPDTFLLIFVIIFSLILTSLFLGKPPLRMLFRHGIVLFIVFFGIKLLGGYLLNLITNFEIDRPEFSSEETVTHDIILEANDTIAVFTSNRNWTDNYGNRFNGPLTVRQADYFSLKDQLKNYIPPPSGNFWGNLYQHLDTTDGPALDLVMKTFSDINSAKQLNKMEFAEMVVSCIQDIPYSFVFQEECLPADYYESSIRDILEKCPDCCVGNVLFGIQNPVSFIQSLKGDCDTRTALIYSILNHFNYDVAILNSDFYKHSIIGINLPSTGKSKLFRGKKYVVWETTAKYYQAGVLPSNFNNLTHWNIVLTSK